MEFSEGDFGFAVEVLLAATPDVETVVLYQLREHLGKPFPFPLQVVPGPLFGFLPEEYDPGRKQYLSTPALARLHSIKPKRALLLGVTGEDLFVPDLNFVFGEAAPSLGCALVSLRRLALSYPGRKLTRDLFFRRILTESVHELGHLFLLSHCRKKDCAMHFSNSLMDTDRKRPELCEGCCGKLE